MFLLGYEFLTGDLLKERSDKILSGSATTRNFFFFVSSLPFNISRANFTRRNMRFILYISENKD